MPAAHAALFGLAAVLLFLPPQPVLAQQGDSDLSLPKTSPLDRPTESRLPDAPSDSNMPDEMPAVPSTVFGWFRTPFDSPIGFTGRSSVLPRDSQTDNNFIPVEDRWRIGFPFYDRYGKDHPAVNDYLYQLGYWWDPYNQNVLKGDFPIMGQHLFLEVTGTSRTVVEPRQVPVGTTPFESTARPFSNPFFGNPNLQSVSQFFVLSFDLFHGDAAFRPIDWRVKVTPIFNINYLNALELAVVNPDVRRGKNRLRDFFSLQEWFVESKIADIGPNYDFVSLRAGSQFFVSDFRGFIFADTNRAVRLFGNKNSNREQFNLIYFSQQEKDTNSELNTFNSRGQDVVIANYYVQDFIFPGYTAQVNAIYNHDDPSFHFDKNYFLVRPDASGVFTPHGLDVCYLGWTGDGHINRFNINHALYYAFGRDSLNPIANRGQDVSAYLGTVELSYDRDYVRFRTSYLGASGDRNPRNSHATGFDGILDNPNFAGGDFSYWQRQAIRLFGVNLVQRESLFPNLRSSKIQGQSNFVNPGLHLFNVGVDVEVTPKWRVINNCNLLWFENTSVLQQFTYQKNIDQFIGVDLSTGVEYRPFLNNNCVLRMGLASLLPGSGFQDLYRNIGDDVGPLVAFFADLILTY